MEHITLEGLVRVAERKPQSFAMLLARLRRGGDAKALSLAKRLEEEGSKYRCVECGFAGDPGIALVCQPNEDIARDGRVVFYCPECSPHPMRPRGVS